MTKPVLKAYYNRVFFEFLTHDEPSDTIVVLEGFPAKSEHLEEISYLYSQGFNVFWPHYPGTYQSHGKFLEKNIVLDLVGFISRLRKGRAISLWDLKEIQFNSKKIILFGSSFSGAICCGLAATSKIDKMILFSPVWDFQNHNKNSNEQDLDALVPFVKRAYENLFRFGWTSLSRKISEFKECNPSFYTKKLKLPILVFHDPSDKIVSIENTNVMKRKIKTIEVIRHNEGHGMGRPLRRNWSQIKRFLNK